MRRLVLVIGVSILLFGGYCPSFSQETRLGQPEVGPAERASRSVDVATLQPACAKQTRQARIADMIERVILVAEKDIAEMEALVSEYGERAGSPEEEAEYARQSKMIVESRREFEKSSVKCRVLIKELIRISHQPLQPKRR